METNSEITKLRMVLSKTGRTKAWAAREINCSYPHFHDVLNGRRNLSEEMKKKINDLLVKVTSPIAG